MPGYHWLQAQDPFDGRRLAEVVRQEGEELAQIPGIGLHGLCREPALLGKRGEPRHRFLAGILRSGKDEIEGILCGAA
jgi:hypothetical protein